MHQPKAVRQGVAGEQSREQFLESGNFAAFFFLLLSHKGSTRRGPSSGLAYTLAGHRVISVPCPSELTGHLSGDPSDHSWLIVLGEGQ